jgi:hypothetical protein
MSQGQSLGHGHEHAWKEQRTARHGMFGCFGGLGIAV